jgi:hypothetical protein
LRQSGFAVDTDIQNRAGIFVWSRLPDRWGSSEDFVAFARERGVLVSAGGTFGDGGQHYIRWALNEPSHIIDEALARLGIADHAQRIA